MVAQLSEVTTMLKCPNCGIKGSYIGITNIECPNASCKYYSKKQEIEYIRRLSELEPTPAEPDTDTKELDWLSDYSD
jgi:hypothetical protein